MIAGARYVSIASFIASGLSGPYAMPAIVVPSPRPVTPSLQHTFTSISVWPCIVATDSLCGRIVGRSTRRVSMRSMVTEDMGHAVEVKFLRRFIRLGRIERPILLGGHFNT